jgi:hypothetical protein
LETVGIAEKLLSDVFFITQLSGESGTSNKKARDDTGFRSSEGRKVSGVPHIGCSRDLLYRPEKGGEERYKSKYVEQNMLGSGRT